MLGGWIAGNVDLTPVHQDGRTYDDGMSDTVRPKPPAPTCAPAYVGPCQGCQEPCHRYGPGGCPLCVLCLDAVEAARGK